MFEFSRKPEKPLASKKTALLDFPTSFRICRLFGVHQVQSTGAGDECPKSLTYTRSDHP